MAHYAPTEWFLLGKWGSSGRTGTVSHEHGELHGTGAPGQPDLGAEPSLPLPPEQERRLLQRPGALRVLSSSFTLFKRGSYQLAPMLLQPEPQHGASALPASSGRQKHCLQLGVTPDTSALCADAESITPLRVWDTQAGPAPREYPPDGVYTTMNRYLIKQDAAA